MNGTCGPAVKIAPEEGNQTSEISVRGSRFHNKPTDACTVAMWVKLDDNSGKHKLFYTLGEIIKELEENRGHTWLSV